MAATLSCVRGGFDLGATTLWAEDGTVFVQGAYEHGLSAFITPYVGYLHLVPRLIAAVSTQLPLAAQAAAMALAAALVQGLVAGVAYVAVRAQRSAIWPALFVAATVAMVPVGPEVIRAVANLQWFLLYGAIIGQLWTPRRRFGWFVTGAVLVATTTGSPFGFVPAALAIARWVVQRRRATFAVAAAGLLGVGAQLPPMAQSTRQLSSGLHPDALTAGFLRRVVADGVLGVGRYVPGTLSTSIIPGAVLTLLVCGLVALLVRHRGLDQALVPALLVAAAGATFVIPVTLTSLACIDPFSGGRYFVAPALMWLAAVVLLVTEALDGRVPSRRAGQSPAGLVAAVLLGASVVGLVTSFHPVTTYGREQVPPWTTAVDQTAKLCAGRSGDALVSVPIAPPGWAVTLTCGEVDQ